MLYVPSHAARELGKDLKAADIPKWTPEGKEVHLGAETVGGQENLHGTGLVIPSWARGGLRWATIWEIPGQIIASAGLHALGKLKCGVVWRIGE